MNRTFKAAIAGAGTVAIVAATAGTALAATPPWQSPATDPNNVGTLTFFDASGNQVTSGSTTVPLGKYVEATGLTPNSGNTKATLYAYTPNPGLAPGAWSGQALTGATTFPNASAPAPLNTDTKPVVTENAATDTTLDDYSNNSFPNTSTTAGYQNVYELRVRTSGTGGADAHYASADITINQATQTWTQVYPTVVTKTATSVVLSATKSGAQVSGTATTLTATVSPSGTAGSVQFADNGTAFGSPVAVSSNTASVTLTPADGSHSYTAIFTPTDTTNFATSPASNAIAISEAPAVSTTTSNVTATPGTGNAYSAQTLSATVTANSGSSLPAGSVQFSDSQQGVLGSAPVTGSGTAGTATLSTNALGAGSHTITATFQPSSAAFTTSNAQGTPFTLAAVGATPDPQTIQVIVDPGSLTISTPYTPANPFLLGHMQLNAGATALVASGHFGDATTPSNGVLIGDTRAGNTNWTASAASSVFQDPASDTIAQSGLSFTNVTASPIAGNALTAANVSTNSITSFTAAPQAFAHSTGGGDGSIYVYGDLNLTAPTSTKAGTYTATVTFTLA